MQADSERITWERPILTPRQAKTREYLQRTASESITYRETYTYADTILDVYRQTHEFYSGFNVHLSPGDYPLMFVINWSSYNEDYWQERSNYANQYHFEGHYCSVRDDRNGTLRGLVAHELTHGLGIQQFDYQQYIPGYSGYIRPGGNGGLRTGQGLEEIVASLYGAKLGGRDYIEKACWGEYLVALNIGQKLLERGGEEYERLLYLGRFSDRYRDLMIEATDQLVGTGVGTELATMYFTLKGLYDFWQTHFDK